MTLTFVIDKITKAIDKKEHTIGLFLDFAEAFDTVNHNILQAKLAHYGIRGNVLQWNNNYLAKIKQTVKCHDTNSALKI